MESEQRKSLFHTVKRTKNRKQFIYSKLTTLQKYKENNIEQQHLSNTFDDAHQHCNTNVRHENKSYHTQEIRPFATSNSKLRTQKMKRILTETQNNLVKCSKNYIAKIKVIEQIQNTPFKESVNDQEFVQTKVIQQPLWRRVATERHRGIKTGDKTKRKTIEKVDSCQLALNQKNKMESMLQSLGRISILCIGDKFDKNLLQPSFPSYRSGLSKQSQSKSTLNFMQIIKQNQRNDALEENKTTHLQEGIGKIKLIKLWKENKNCQIFQGILKTFEKCQKNDDVVIKKIKVNEQFISRQQFMAKNLKSPFIVEFKGTYKTKEIDNIKQKNQMDYFEEGKKSEFLNIVMEKYETDLGELLGNSVLSPQTIRVYFYQMVRALLYLHSYKICHRDLKPQNFFVKKWRIVLGDFGMSKIIKRGYNKITKTDLFNLKTKDHHENSEDEHTPYVFSRQYRAPELLLGYESYSLAVDIWALGCILAEMLLGKPLFNGSDSLDQLIKIMKVMGSPRWQKLSFYHNSVKLPKIKGIGLQSIFQDVQDKQVLVLLEKMLKFDPKDRITAIQILCSPYFDPLRQQSLYRKIISEYNCPNFFHFTRKQIFGNQQYMNKLIPFWVKEYCRKYGIKISEIKKM